MSKFYVCMVALLLVSCESSSVQSRADTELAQRVTTLEERVWQLETLLSGEQELRHVGDAGVSYEFIGTLELLASPPAQDIGYRYVLRLSQPVSDPLHATGNPIVYQFVTVPTKESDIDLAPYVRKKVRMQGTVEWGYAESRIIAVTHVQEAQ
ncbi:hypothetical protein COU78_03290 [Candidatus Peregrinibacteria bacterium CG10_big_fil_rev_8_21_14_0_10_49_24]|nr:MAG: hypothetical protein COV83_05110 [Candidatus Peregrinibacteria bacterium CG11_big_fil_rev_8_21_14_0_20_49_14]PIR51147.1 MAG: hypothetical protein COU78_03290 [Candidatus Peregrinibacteria bacterium CG10_big_fil_rev_8_21_14_0_10_49_24]PJA67186.1 MAG: hypothetical protein CO157_05445 [Candidatus Peregrinibacteria bacterium CG_4_9_14_3_um_filter_49_12]